MKIGYRRVAGKIGLTNQEAGVRGAWVEKRVALFKSFMQNGHGVYALSDLTDPTIAKGFIGHKKYKQCDVLVLEFGGTNLQFYRKYWDETLEMIKAHKGRIIFINDDPDLPFLWDLLPDEDWSRWTVAANAINCAEVASVLKCPRGVRVVDFPMHSGMSFSEFSAGIKDSIVYIGRPNGRTKYFETFLQSPNLKIAGKPEEWDKFPVSVIPSPQQRLRKQFYAQFKGCLAVYDDKHKKTGWRTGRAFHALYAGIPVCAPKGNAGLGWCFPVDSAKDITKFCALTDAERKSIWEKQTKTLSAETVDLLAL